MFIEEKNIPLCFVRWPTMVTSLPNFFFFSSRFLLLFQKVIISFLVILLLFLFIFYFTSCYFTSLLVFYFIYFESKLPNIKTTILGKMVCKIYSVCSRLDLIVDSTLHGSSASKGIQNHPRSE